MKKVYISGIGPGPHGVSKLIEYLISKKTNVICPKASPSLKSAEFLKIKAKIIFILRFFLDFIIFKARLTFLIIRGGMTPIIIHHHSIGLLYTYLIIKRFPTVYYYCVDSSFFCIKSYNQINSNECILCAKGEQREKTCTSFPAKISPRLHDLIFKLMQSNYSKIKFLAQNKLQAELCFMSYPKSEVNVVGLATNDITEEVNMLNTKIQYNSLRDDEKKYMKDFFVYHGSPHEAKGFMTLFENEENLSVPILFPFSKKQAEDEIFKLQKKIKLPQHWVFESMRWDNGLKKACNLAKGVICPSIWSAPIEGAFIKSLCVNNFVLIRPSSYSFYNEISTDIVIDFSKVSLNTISKKIESFNILQINSRREKINKFLFNNFLVQNSNFL
tara:strand:- start:258 stop:1415 length:1158 start_codon:yes stop_codon:yes gene_type:complete